MLKHVHEKLTWATSTSQSMRTERMVWSSSGWILSM